MKILFSHLETLQELDESLRLPGCAGVEEVQEVVHLLLLLLHHHHAPLLPLLLLPQHLPEQWAGGGEESSVGHGQAPAPAPHHHVPLHPSPQRAEEGEDGGGGSGGENDSVTLLLLLHRQSLLLPPRAEHEVVRVETAPGSEPLATSSAAVAPPAHGHSGNRNLQFYFRSRFSQSGWLAQLVECYIFQQEDFTRSCQGPQGTFYCQLCKTHISYKWFYSKSVFLLVLYCTG